MRKLPASSIIASMSSQTFRSRGIETAPLRASRDTLSTVRRGLKERHRSETVHNVATRLATSYFDKIIPADMIERLSDYEGVITHSLIERGLTKEKGDIMDLVEICGLMGLTQYPGKYFREESEQFTFAQILERRAELLEVNDLIGTDIKEGLVFEKGLSIVELIKLEIEQETQSAVTLLTQIGLIQQSGPLPHEAVPRYRLNPQLIPIPA